MVSFLAFLSHALEYLPTAEFERVYEVYRVALVGHPLALQLLLQLPFALIEEEVSLLVVDAASLFAPAVALVSPPPCTLSALVPMVSARPYRPVVAATSVGPLLLHALDLTGPAGYHLHVRRCVSWLDHHFSR